MTHDHGAFGLDMPTATTTDRSATGAPVALLPIGSFEQHGPHLPLVTDTLIATAISESISSQHNAFQLPRAGVRMLTRARRISRHREHLREDAECRRQRRC